MNAARARLARARQRRLATSALSISLLVLFLAWPGLAPSATADTEILAGGAATRGYFDWAVLGGAAWSPTIGDLPQGIDLPLRAEGLFSTRENLTNLGFGILPTVRWQVPGFAGNHLGPYVATGPGLQFQVAWSDLRDFGGVEVKSHSTVKWHVFLGASLVRGRRTDLIVETRYTAPSELTFDYLLIALRFHAPR